MINLINPISLDVGVILMREKNGCTFKDYFKFYETIYGLQSSNKPGLHLPEIQQTSSNAAQYKYSHRILFNCSANDQCYKILMTKVKFTELVLIFVY